MFNEGIFKTIFKIIFSPTEFVHCVSKRGTPTLSIVTLRGIDGFSRFFAQTFLTQLAIKRLFKFQPYPTSVSTLPGETEQTKYALK